MTSRPERIYIAGLPVVPADVLAAQNMIWADVAEGCARLYVLVNAYSATLRRCADYADALSNDSSIPLPDGLPVAAAAWFFGHRPLKHCPGPDLLEHAARVAAADGTSFFLLGGGPGVVEELGRSLTRRHPGLVVSGVATPPFGTWPDETSRALARDVVSSGADVLWLGVSAPKQEAWALEWMRDVGKPIVCVGAAFDFASGNKGRAPRLLRVLGLEWLHRLVLEPGRLWKRYLLGNAVFTWDLMRYGRRSARDSTARV